MEPQIVETNDVTYEFTAETFQKTSRLPWDFVRNDGTHFEWFRSWNHERIINEVKALQLVSEKTTIPVPKLLGHGALLDGRQYLITERIDGVTLNRLRGEDCESVAYSNALDFINNIVLPQLGQLRCNERGIDGFVMPPSWLSPDVQPPWRGKTHWKTLPLKEPEYVFQHGDLGAHNIMIDPKSLQVMALIDWEYAGFFPPEMQRWPGTLDETVYNRRGDHVADAIAEFLSDEYLECYCRWEDKAELDDLIRSGQLPDPKFCTQRGGVEAETQGA
ncbi:hypothetical protein LZ554_009560 [Drepanopeziza brunnea f. sp. 'monogermtubi']|nr:hypothetical protein LZ554_009560 [Drepanopeziza brunnea f. sp. 'monogermtubi']